MYTCACLISGGKDSILAMSEAAQLGHRVVALLNLAPPWDSHSNTKTSVHNNDSDGGSGGVGQGGDVELDSYMFQSAGSAAVELQAAALRLPLFRRTITKHSSIITTMEYHTSTDNDSNHSKNDNETKTLDEVEEMYLLVKHAREYMKVHSRECRQREKKAMNTTAITSITNEDNKTLLKQHVSILHQYEQ